MNSPGPATLVIFGVTGDLSKRYLLPALYHLCKDNLLPEPFVILGTSRRHLEPHDFLKQVELCILEQDNTCDPEVLKRLESTLRLVRLNPTSAADYRSLKQQLDDIETERGVCMNRLYYLSIPPQLYPPVVRNLGEQGLQATCQHGTAASRLVVEKPFGYDVTSAQSLIEETDRHFSEDQVFRIDHYLAKETVQDILLFRRGNPDIETRWDGKHIRNIEIIAYESLGVEGRHFYDQIGALRDLIQSHLLQLLGLTVMDLPGAMEAREIHAAKEALLADIPAFSADKVPMDTVRGQYEGYAREIDNEDSTTETFAGIRFMLPGSRWEGTEAVIATGKALKAKRTAITINFRDGERVCFLVQPEAAIESSVALNTGFDKTGRAVRHRAADAYEYVLIDALRGDQTLFASAKEVMSCWRIVQPILNEWAKGQPALRLYRKGSEPSDLIEFQ